MLEGLDKVPWATLNHARGPASDVPDQLRDLRSPDEKCRTAAIHALFGNIVHTAGQYQATSHAVPFLLELLADPATPVRADLLIMLTTIAVGNDSQWLPDNLPIAEYRAKVTGIEALFLDAPRPGPDRTPPSHEQVLAYLATLSEEELHPLDLLPIVATYDAVRAGVPLFRTLLADDDLGVQFLAAYALAWFVEDAAESLPALTAAAERATPAGSEILVATIWVTVGLLGGRPPAAGLHDPRPLVRWAVAVAMAKNGEADQVAIDELFVWARGAARSSLAVPFLDYDVAGYAALALVQALGEDSERIFAVLLTRLPLVSGLKALPVLGLAVKLAFPAGPMTPGTPYAALSERQQQLLLALADSPQIWRTDDAVFADASRTVREYGLPDSAERLRAYLHPAPNTP